MMITKNSDDRKIKKLYLLIIVLIIIIFGMGVFMAINVLTTEDDKKSDTSPETSDEVLVNLTSEQIEQIFTLTTYAINPLANFENDLEINVNDLSDGMLFDYAFRYLFDNELYIIEKFDNSNYDYASDEEFIISVNQITETISSVFGKKDYNNFPGSYWYDPRFISFDKLADNKYHGKTIITGGLAEPEYRYVLVDNKIKEENLIMTVCAAYDAVESVYKDDKLNGHISEFDFDWEWTEKVKANPEKYKEQLYNLEFVFKLTSSGYRFVNIKIN